MARELLLSSPQALPLPPAPARWHALLEALLQALPEGRPAPLRPEPDTVDETLLELDLRGQRYFLVCRRACPPAPHSLSPRELAIAHLVARGLPNKAIGDVLDISPWTVATHLRRVYAKLDVTTRAAMVAALTARHLL